MGGTHKILIVGRGHLQRTSLILGASASTFLLNTSNLHEGITAVIDAPVQRRRNFLSIALMVASWMVACAGVRNVSSFCRAAEAGRFAQSDSSARYVHWIDLYDTANRKITADSKLPYSPKNTCGRCHDYDAISHGWHFNAMDPTIPSGRPSEPWIWTDPRTGTQLPLTYRVSTGDRSSVFDPREVGVTAWQMTVQFGDRFAGGGFASKPPAAEPGTATSRWDLAGSMEVDCMVCHADSGSYDFESRRAQIENENFAWSATAAIHLGTVQGQVSRIKDGVDPQDEKTISMLPQVSYDADRFASDGKVFFDVLREPPNNACYGCHSNGQVVDGAIQSRWVHDEDVHLRAGMLCVDCHRNGIEHHTVRGFAGEMHPTGTAVHTLSCSGCHLGAEPLADQISARGGRLGSPRPLHAGLPPVHFERLSCTACHSGPAPRDAAIGMLTSLAHGLGSSEHRSGSELPLIQGPAYVKLNDGKVYPQRMVWPAYWGKLDGDALTPLSPLDVYEWTRKSLRVRKSFVDEVASDPEKFDEKIVAALVAIEKESGAKRAVYVSTGRVYARGNVGLEELTKMEADVGPVTWPIAHEVRPAGWSLGVGGCIECHRDGGKIFDSTVRAVGPVKSESPAISMASLQGVDANQRLLWNRLFGGRASFKLLVAGSLMVLAIVMLLGLASAGASLAKQRSVNTSTDEAS